jgi:hypothetical protein
MIRTVMLFPFYIYGYFYHYASNAFYKGLADAEKVRTVISKLGY